LPDLEVNVIFVLADLLKGENPLKVIVIG